MEKEEFELVLEIVSNAIRDEYLMPMNAALCLLTTAVCHKKDRAWLEKALRTQLETCPHDLAGRAVLEVLIEIASSPNAPDPGDAGKAASTFLKLIPGGKNQKS